ncbi:hypothetical protein [Mycolicibacterium baixiangningiae]|uniref:hypothetical protein n=1 Tax=Mycolicibacterium baixiangningiae TaxID=2761578 RepID=UPI001867B7E4|nr:hypothetical protein [Mycolicibacterium baixiangningiae]
MNAPVTLGDWKIAEENGWPLLRGERGFGKLAIFLAAFSATMATWCFSIGGFVSYYLGATPGDVRGARRIAHRHPDGDAADVREVRHRLGVASRLYLPDRSSKYYYLAGFNPVGFVAFAAGIAVYIYLLDPISYVHRAPFQYLSASFPSAIIAGAVYIVGTLLFLRPRGIGGYGASAPAERVRSDTTPVA